MQYDVLIENINPCGGEKHAIRTLSGGRNRRPGRMGQKKRKVPGDRYQPEPQRRYHRRLCQRKRLYRPLYVYQINCMQKAGPLNGEVLLFDRLQVCSLRAAQCLLPQINALAALHAPKGGSGDAEQTGPISRAAFS